MIIILVCIGFAVIVAALDGTNYIFLTPIPLTTPASSFGHSTRLARWLHGATYVLSILRLPFAVTPFLAKSCLYLLLGNNFAPWWKRRSIQAIRLLGDFVNFWLIAILLQAAAPFAPNWLTALINAAILAEATRLILEKGQMLVSAGWQFLPHRQLATWFKNTPFKRWLSNYCNYYSLSDDERLNYVIQLIRQWGTADPIIQSKLRYVRAFRVVADSVDLRSGQVRNVACGEIYIHARWSNDPWLLIGQTMRRSPWLFDPRHLQRPFFYRTQANPLATRFVLEYAHYSPPFALYQLGHEIKVARFEIFYRLSRALGFQLETPVQADGTYPFDPALAWLSARFGRSPAPTSHPLVNEAEVLVRLTQSHPINLSAEAIASIYSLPLVYVEEVLLPAISKAEARVADTVSGTSQ